MTSDSADIADTDAATRRLANRAALPFYGYAILANSIFQRGVFVLYLIHQGFSASQIALLQTLLYITSGLAEIPTGYLADRIGRRTSIVVGQLLGAGCLVGQIAESGLPSFALLFVLQGIGFAFVSGAENALLYDLLRKQRAETHYIKVQSRFSTLSATTMAVAIAVGGLLQQISWQLVYLASAGALILAAVVLLARVPEVRGKDAAGLHDAPDAQAPRKALWRLLNPRLAVLIVVSGLMHATLTPYFIFTQGTLDGQGVATTAVGVVMSIGFLLGGATPLLAVRADRRLGLGVMVPLTMVVLVGALALTGLGSPWLTAALFLVAAGVPEITVVLLDNTFQEAVPSRFRASLLSAVSFVESCLIGLGYLMLGWLTDAFGPSGGIAWYAVLPALGLLLCIPVAARRRHETSPGPEYLVCEGQLC